MATAYYEFNAFYGPGVNNFNCAAYDNIPMNDPLRWDSLSPEPRSGSHSEASTPFYAVKTEYVNSDDYFGGEKATFGAKSTTVPTASAEAANASLQTAFNRRPSKTTPSDAACANVKTEILDDNVFNFNSNFNRSTSGNGNLDAQQMEIYRDLILRHLIQDISTTCAKLGLPTDPYNWTEEHGARWIMEMCQQFNLNPPAQMFVSGRVLLSMSQKDFEAVAPESGDTLHAQLQVWKTAFESYHQQQQPIPAGQSAGMTAADNSSPKISWMTSQTGNMSASPTGTPNYFAANSSNFSETLPLSFFQAPNVMPSPCNSEMSSNASIQDMTEEDLDLGMINMQRTGMFPLQYINPMSDVCGAGQGDGEDKAFPRHSGTVHLWHFIRELLDQPKQYGQCVRWVDREEGTFKIESSHHLARYWGQRKNRSQMNYDKLSRSLRQYYKKGIIQKPEKKQRLVYKFLPPYNY